MNIDLIKYFEKQLNNKLNNHIEIYIENDTICTDIDYHSNFLETLDINECKKIFPNFTSKYIAYEYPIIDEYEFGNAHAEELHFSGLDLNSLTKEKIDKFCEIFSKAF